MKPLFLFLVALPITLLIRRLLGHPGPDLRTCEPWVFVERRYSALPIEMRPGFWRVLIMTRSHCALCRWRMRIRN